MRVGQTALAIALIASLGGNIFLYSELAKAPVNARGALVNRALAIHGRGTESRSELLKIYNPVVVGLPDMTCVALKLKRGWAGGSTTICFDKAEQGYLFSYRDGD